MPMSSLRNVTQEQAVAAFLRFGGVERGTKKTYRMVSMPNQALLAIPSGVLLPGTLRVLIRHADLTADQLEGALG